MVRRTPRPALRAVAVCLGVSLFLAGCGAHNSNTIVPGTAQSVAGGASTAAGAQKRSVPWAADMRHRTDKVLGQFASHALRMPASSNEPVTADMPVSRPHETPCIVTLFSNYSFEDYNNHTFPYTPPASPCAGPWNKVVLDVNLNVSAGIQYDRTGSIWVGGTNVWFGTTAEPSPSQSPTWHVERDVTDLAPIFTSASTGNVFIGNNMCCGLTGIIYGTAQLEFYPATSQYPAADTPDLVYSLANPPPGNNTFVGPYESPALTGTFTFPQNVERAYLDVYLQGQSSFDNYPLQGYDEFWYACLPNDLAQKMVGTYNLAQCEGTGFREGEVAIDGQPAGVAPIYPWIFTGGWDPYLWIPVPGVETLNFNPYRVDLTPFAGLLDNGMQHTVSITVFNDQDYFSSNAELLLYEDHGQSVDTGYLKANGTTPTPSQHVTEGVTFGSSALTGPVKVFGFHTVSLDGILNTSKGTIETQVQQHISFSNAQQLNVAYNGLTWQQNVTQKTQVDSQTTTIAHGSRTTAVAQVVYPFTLDYYFFPTSSGYQQNTTVEQQKEIRTATIGKGPLDWSTTSNTVNATDQLLFDSSFNLVGAQNGSSNQHYKYSDNTGRCYNKKIITANYVVVGTFNGC